MYKNLLDMRIIVTYSRCNQFNWIDCKFGWDNFLVKSRKKGIVVAHAT